MTTAAITVDGWTERLAQLAVRQGLHLASLQQRDGRDLELIFATAALAFPEDRLLTERDANELLKTFLAGAGAMIATDHVELRRWLVDAGFVRRSDRGTDYRRGAFPAWLADAAASLDSTRLAEVVASARAAQRHAARGPAAGLACESDRGRGRAKRTGAG